MCFPLLFVVGLSFVVVVCCFFCIVGESFLLVVVYLWVVRCFLLVGARCLVLCVDVVACCY